MTCSKNSRRAAIAVNAAPTPPAPTSRTRSGSLTDVRHHVLDARVVLEAVERQVLAVAGVLEATVRHLGNDRDVRVDPDAAEVQSLCHPHGPAVVLRPYRRRQTVLRAVGPPDGLVLITEALHGDDRTE